MAMRGGGVLVQLMAWGAGWACWVEAGGGATPPVSLSVGSKASCRSQPRGRALSELGQEPVEAPAFSWDREGRRTRGGLLTVGFCHMRCFAQPEDSLSRQLDSGSGSGEDTG